RFQRSTVAGGGDLEPTDGPARQQPDDHSNHRRDEAAQRPAEDDDDRMFLGGRPAAPHQQRDHGDGAGAAEHARGGGEQAVNVALALGEGQGRGKWFHVSRSDSKVAKVVTSTRARESVLTNPVRQPAVEKGLIGWAPLREAEVALALE